MNYGLEILSLDDASQLIHLCRQFNYSYPIAPLVSENLEELINSNPPSPTLDNLIISDVHTARSVFCFITPWIELDSNDPIIQLKSQILLKQQCQWVSHCGLKNVLIYFPTNVDVVQFSKMIQSIRKELGSTALVIRTSAGQGSWERWNALRSLLDSSNISIALYLDDPHEAYEWQKWYAEPVSHLILSSSLFSPNVQRYPMLSIDLQYILWDFMELSVDIICSFDNESVSEYKDGIGSFQQYIQHLFETRPAPCIVDHFAKGYHDCLQAPLQPLMDHLESATYEVFEMDPVKYSEYERAVYRALLDRFEPHSTTPAIITVVGAGRGPLVDRVLKAAEMSQRNVKLVALEKNPNAIITLQQRKKKEWGDRVTLIHSDMRDYTPKELSDILVSELLGSFGDNELSPECLDGAQKLLHENGISIPCKYTAFISPIFTPKLYYSAGTDLKSLETPYVVKFRQVQELADPLPVWSFEHPQSATCFHDRSNSFFNSHNQRYAAVEFTMNENSLLHGCAGYFEAILYKDVTLSILPSTHSKDMFSWFPIYFPIPTPIFLCKDSKLKVHFWRCTDAKKVWYEWAFIPVSENGELVIGKASQIINPNGRSYWIGL